MTTPQDRRSAARIGKLLDAKCWQGTRDGTALESALDTVKHGYSTFQAPLDRVAETLLDSLSRSAGLARALGEAAGAWAPAKRDALLLVGGYTAMWALEYGRFLTRTWDDAVKAKAARFQANVTALVAALSPATDKTVSRRMAQWGLAPRAKGAAKGKTTGKAVATSPPKALPATLDGALALRAALGLGRDAITLGPAAKSVPKGLPAPLAAFYAKHGRLGDRAVVAPSKIGALRAAFARTATSHREEDEGQVAKGDIHLLSLSGVARLVPFGKDAAGDCFFLNPAFAGGEPVLRFRHDEAMTVSVEASSLATFVAACLLRAAFGDGLHADAVRALVTKDRKRVRVPASLSRRPK